MVWRCLAPFRTRIAELVLAEAILLMRGIPEKSAKAHRDEWQKTAKILMKFVLGKRSVLWVCSNIGAQLA